MLMEQVFLHGYVRCNNTSRRPPENPSGANNRRFRPPLYDPGKFFRRSSLKLEMSSKSSRLKKPLTVSAAGGGMPLPPLDLTEDNVNQVLLDARDEFGQIFDAEVGMTGEVELAELDGPFVKIRLKGRFWHKRSTVLARLGNYLKQRIPEILEVEIEDEKQLDDSPANF